MSPCQTGQIQGFLTLVKLITEIKHEVGLAQSGTDSWSFSLFLLTSPSLFFSFKTSGDALPSPEVRLAMMLVQTVPL